MNPKSFSYELERNYYSQRWPEEAKPYLHLEPHLRCWFDPEAMLGWFIIGVTLLYPVLPQLIDLARHANINLLCEKG